MYLGVRAVITKSFARIHKANLINYGILPITFKNPADYDAIADGDTLELTGIFESLKEGKDFTITLHGKSGDKVITGVNDLAERSRNILLAGGLALYTKAGGQ